MVIDFKNKEIKFKIVYYGPGLSGKTTNLKYIFSKFMGPKGKLLSVDTKGERTLFFDLLPIEINLVKGFKTRFFLYTVPGQVFYKAARKLVLRGADCVVFVADSSQKRMEENKELFKEMHQNLKMFGLSDGNKIPIIMQYNKRDLPDKVPINVLERELNIYHYPYILAIAYQGKGVMKTLEMAIKLIIKEHIKKQKAKAKG